MATSGMGKRGEERKQTSSSRLLPVAEHLEGGAKFSKVVKKGRHVVRIMNLNTVADVINDGNNTAANADFQHLGVQQFEKILVSRPTAIASQKHAKMIPGLSIESTINPDTLIARTLHSYLCSCGNLPRLCPYPATMIDPEVTRFRLIEIRWQGASIMKRSGHGTAAKRDRTEGIVQWWLNMMTILECVDVS